MDPTGLYSLFPGLRILVPTTAFDYVGLFNAAMLTKSPTVIIEHHEFYGHKGMIPADDLDYLVQPGKAKILRPGSQVTAAAYGYMVDVASRAAGQLAAEGIDVEVIDLRTVDDAGIDYELIGRSLEKTGRLVTLEQAMRCNSIGAKIVRECEQRFFDYLDGAAVCVNAPDVPLPVSRRLEQACMPSVNEVREALRSAALRRS
jgi:2-oxoisovalerate dehydrogenase E1 component